MVTGGDQAPVDESRGARLDASGRRLLGQRVRDRRLTGAFERGAGSGWLGAKTAWVWALR